MNNSRRTALRMIVERLEELKAELGLHRDDEQDYYDNMPESLQAGEPGNKAEEAASYLDDAVNSLDEVISSIGSSVQS